MVKLIDWIKHHQVAAFFIAAFVITWGLGFTWSGIIQHNRYLLLPLAFVATCGPGLAGILITAIVNTLPRQGPRWSFWVAFFTAWIFCLLVALANSAFIQQVSLTPAMVVLFSISVVPVAFIIASAYSRIPSVRAYLASLIHPRGAWSWSLLGLVLFPVLQVISLLVNSLLNGQPIPSFHFQGLGWKLLGLVIIKFLYQFFFFNATGEETGWRGFALPRLQTRASPLIAALVIALFWVPWHFFLWQASGSPVLTFQFWAGQYAVHILSSLFIVWIYNRSHGSIFVAGITHASANTVMAIIPIQDVRGLYLTWAAILLVIILVDRMWKKLPPDHPAVYQTPR